MGSPPDELLDREERIRRVLRYLAALGLRRGRALLFGSVARGDFVRESDTDLLVVSDELPADLRARLALLADARTVAPEVEAIGWREEEWERRARRGDPFLGILRREAVEIPWPSPVARPPRP